jgi:hypothetical protein
MAGSGLYPILFSSTEENKNEYNQRLEILKSYLRSPALPQEEDLFAYFNEFAMSGDFSNETRLTAIFKLMDHLIKLQNSVASHKKSTNYHEIISVVWENGIRLVQDVLQNFDSSKAEALSEEILSAMNIAITHPNTLEKAQALTHSVARMNKMNDSDIKGVKMIRNFMAFGSALMMLGGLCCLAIGIASIPVSGAGGLAISLYFAGMLMGISAYMFKQAYDANKVIKRNVPLAVTEEKADKPRLFSNPKLLKSQLDQKSVAIPKTKPLKKT